MTYRIEKSFEWDEDKDLENQKKHGVSFEEAAVLFGLDYLEIFDAEHSDAEDRFLAVGPISRGIVIVVWTEGTQERIRIISARMASRAEVKLYGERT